MQKHSEKRAKIGTKIGTKLNAKMGLHYMSVTKALIEMMEEMPFEDIKVKELCDRAMIRKSTFYKHFADKYELLAFIVKEVIND